jgi:hypothetical protein
MKYLVKGEKIFASSDRIAGKALIMFSNLMVKCQFVKKQSAQRGLKKEKYTAKLV